MTAFQITIDSEADLATATANGAVTEGDFMEAFHRFYKEKPAGRVLWDFSKASLANLTFSKINTVLRSSMYDGRPALGKTALVLRPSYAYGMVRIFETLLEMQNAHFETRSFDSTEEAFSWFYRGFGPVDATDSGRYEFAN